MTAVTPFSVLTAVPPSTRSFMRMVIISHRRHVAAVAKDDDTLVVSTDWLAWRQCLDEGRAAIHFEAMLADWPTERGDAATCHLRHCEWVYLDGVDATLFHGVSLGKLFVRDVTLACNAFERLWHAVDRACARYRPAEIRLIDMRAEQDLIDECHKRRIVREVAARHGAAVVETLDCPPAGDPGFPERVVGYGAPSVEPWLRRSLRAIFTESLDVAARVRDAIVGTRKKIFILNNWATTRTLAKGFPDTVAPALLAGTLPKHPRLLWTWFKAGVVFVSPPPARLNVTDRARLAAIETAFTAAWEAPAHGVEAARRDFIRDRVFRSGWLAQMAAQVKSYHRAFARHRFHRVVLGDSTNGLCRLIAEVGRCHGVKVDELLNGMFVTAQRYDSRSGDAHGGPVIDRLLAWGVQQDLWAKGVGGRFVSARTGYPALDPLRSEARPLDVRRALVLPIYADCDDTMAFTSNIFANLVETVRALRRFGCDAIRVKLHSGPQNLEYYGAVLRHFDLDVEIVKGGALDPHIEWCGFVVGPVNSGAFVETLAAGKPYYPVRPQPSLIDGALLGPTRPIATAEELVAMLERRETIDRDAVLEHFCSFRSIPDSSRRFWDVMAQDA